MKVIFNADDAGYTPGVNKGIEEAFQKGVVRSTTMMANMPYFGDAAEMVKQNGDLGAGVHLNLTAGVPLTGAKSLMVNGAMTHTGFEKATQYEIRKELTMQIETVRAAGILITHLDSHHHVHGHPLVAPVVLALAKEYDLPLRKLDSCNYRSPDRLFVDFFDKNAKASTILAAVEQALRDGVETLEIMCHPGYCDDLLKKWSSYNTNRDNELRILCSEELKKGLLRVTLDNYS